jgi:hypothetical protein
LAQGRSCSNQIANSFKCHKSDILCLTLVEKEERLADLANAASGSTHPVTTPEVGVFGAEVRHKVDADLITSTVKPTDDRLTARAKKRLVPVRADDLPDLFPALTRAEIATSLACTLSRSLLEAGPGRQARDIAATPQL